MLEISAGARGIVHQNMLSDKINLNPA